MKDTQSLPIFVLERTAKEAGLQSKRKPSSFIHKCTIKTTTHDLSEGFNKKILIDCVRIARDD
jgi:hypothetical protein